MADLLREPYEGPGRQAVWTVVDQVSSTSSVDDTIPTSDLGNPVGWGTTCSRYTVATTSNCYDAKVWGAEQAVTYSVFEAIVNEWPLVANQYFFVAGMFGTGGSVLWYSVAILSSGTQYVATYIFHNGTQQLVHAAVVNSSTDKHKFGVKWDKTGATYEVKYDNTTVASGSLTGAALGWGSTQLSVGNLSNTNPGPGVLFLDNVVVSDSGWPGGFTGEVGTFNLTGQSAGLLATRTIPAAVGTFTLTGVAAGLLATRFMSAAAGTFALTGKDVAFINTSGPVSASIIGALGVTQTLQHAIGLGFPNANVGWASHIITNFNLNSPATGASRRKVLLATIARLWMR